MDVDDDDSVRVGVAGVLAACGRIDALVAAAGWALAGAVEQCTIGEAKAQLETNFWGCVRVVQQVLPAMRAQGGGRIVLIGSVGGVIGIPFEAFYSASKFALEGFGEALAYEVVPFGVHVTLVEPGNVSTGIRRRLAQAAGDPAYRAAATRAVDLMARNVAAGVPAAASLPQSAGSWSPGARPGGCRPARRPSGPVPWPGGCCRSACSKPPQSAAWESDSRTFALQLPADHGGAPAPPAPAARPPPNTPPARQPTAARLRSPGATARRRPGRNRLTRRPPRPFGHPLPGRQHRQAQPGAVLRIGNPGAASPVTGAHNRVLCATQRRQSDHLQAEQNRQGGNGGSRRMATLRDACGFG